MFVWQLPQNLLGLLVILVTKAEKFAGVYVATRFNKSWSGVSLGDYIIFSGKYTETSWKHEKGHQKQSKYLGWLYLVIIGLPSLAGNILHRYIKFDYYKNPVEHWADVLGGVNRRLACRNL